MLQNITRAHERGVSEHGWLSSRFSFSFADYYNPKQMGFGALRVINDDSIAPNTGFDMHGHRDMEIITIVLDGEVTHEDSMGNKKKVEAGEVQIMSAGTGVTHSEHNRNPMFALKLFQIWIFPHTRGFAPRYAQKKFVFQENTMEVVVEGVPFGVLPDSWESSDVLKIVQDAQISIGKYSTDKEFQLEIPEGSGVYILVIDGSFEIAGTLLESRDAVAISEVSTLSGKSIQSGSILVIQVPMLSR